MVPVILLISHVQRRSSTVTDFAFPVLSEPLILLHFLLSLLFLSILCNYAFLIVKEKEISSEYHMDQFYPLKSVFCLNDWSHDERSNLCMQLARSLFASHVLGTRLSIQNETKGTLSISCILRQIWINIEMYANRILIRRMERWSRGSTRSAPNTYIGQLTTTGNYNSCLFQHIWILRPLELMCTYFHMDTHII